MTAQALLDLSAPVEHVALWATVLLLAVIAAASLRRPRPEVATGVAWERALAGRRELAWLALIVVVAAALRTVGWRSALTAPYYFAHTATVQAAMLLEQGTWAARLRELLQNQHLNLLEGSAVMLPIALAFQKVLGPSLHLPLLIGAFFGTATVVLAWWLGRTAESRTFGLLFAALVAISPAAIVWSRHGGLWIGAPAHVLLVLALAWTAGRRGSVGLGVLAGVAIWLTLNHYYAARVAIPFAFVALGSGIAAGRRGTRRGLGVVSATLVTLAAIYALVRPPDLVGAIWPRYTGYVGNRAEKTLGEVMEGALFTARHQLPGAARAYLWQYRASARIGGWAHPTRSGPSALTAGMDNGGLALLPLGVLGLIGLLRCLAAPRRRLLWLLLAAGGIALPALSATTARRLLVFDVAWCALAAHGVLALVDSRLLRALSARTAAWITAGALGALGGWSFATIVLLNRVLPPNSASVIPFGESGFGDGRACLGCLRAAERWQAEMAQDRMVVMFDTDAFRENPTLPGGLRLYGKVAALAAGHPRRFLAFYPLMANFDPEPPAPGALYGADTTFAGYLAARIEKARPREIVWDFEQPTMWERWLGDRLVAAGGRRVELPPARLAMLRVTESAAAGDEVRRGDAAFAIVTPWDQRQAALEVFRRLAQESLPSAEPCVVMQTVGSTPGPFILATPVPASGGSDGTVWATASIDRVRVGDHVLPFGDGAALGYEAGTEESLHLLSVFGQHVVWKPSTGQRTVRNDTAGRTVGYECAAFVADRWWIVDPLSGEASAAPPSPHPLPRGPWVGIARWSDHEIVLASAAQALHVVDVTTGLVTRRFAAAVWPAHRRTLGECSPVVVGGGWVGTLNHLRRTMNVYDRAGTPLGVIVVWPGGGEFSDLLAIAAHDADFVLGSWTHLQIGRIVRVPGCGTITDRATVRDASGPPLPPRAAPQ